MTGNVGEFVADAFEETFYRHSPQDNPNNAQESKITSPISRCEGAATPTRQSFARTTGAILPASR